MNSSASDCSGLSLEHTESPKESLWKRGRDEIVFRPGSKLKVTVNTLNEKFDKFKYVNLDLDIDTKRAALKASPSVVGLISRSRADGEILFRASGTIYETVEGGDGRFLSTILTSATLIGSSNADVVKLDVYVPGGKVFDGEIVGCDAHYNLAIVKIVPDVRLPAARLRLLDESVSIDPVHSSGDSGQLRPHSMVFKICAGEMTVALGRDCETSEIMVAPGQFSIDDCGYDCIELMKATCKITKPGIGGPLVNRFGEVIGLNFMNEEFTPFLAVNVVEKWLNLFKKNEKFVRPSFGVVATNLFAARVSELEHVVLNFPEVTRGVFIETVAIGSPAERAGLESCDVIIRLNGKWVRGFLKFCCKMLNKCGKSVEVDVIRRGHDGLLKLNVAVEEFTQDNFNIWPLPEERSYYTNTTR